MQQLKTSSSLKHFARHFFIVNKVYIARNKSKKEVYLHLDKMRKSIIRMTLTYSDVDRLRQKIDGLLDLESRYAKFFKSEDNETKELKNKINQLENELKVEREEKLRITSENNDKINQLTETLKNIKSQMNLLHMEKARRQQRLNALETKIKGKIDIHRYYNS